MPGGTHEERLRAWVRRALKAERGQAAALARYLQREESWVSMYVAAARDADFDTSIAMGRFFHLPLAQIVGDAPLPPLKPAAPIPPDLWRLMRILRLLDRRERTALLAVARALARQQQSVRARGSLPETGANIVPNRRGTPHRLARDIPRRGPKARAGVD